MCDRLSLLEPVHIRTGKRPVDGPMTRQIAAAIESETYEAIRAAAEARGASFAATLRAVLRRGLAEA